MGMYIRRPIAIVVIISSLVCCLCTTARSAEKSPDYPRKPIRFVVPYAVGSGIDINARGIAPYLEKHLGVNILVDNRPGADGRIGVNDAWKAAPDGYTLVNPAMPIPIISEKLYQVNYRTREFTHIFAWSVDNVVLVVNSETWKTPEEFIAAAKAKTLSCGITGVASVSYLAGLSLGDAANFKPVNWVPFTGGAETMTALAGKHIDFGITTCSSARGLVDAGKLRPLLIFANEKDSVFPNAPLPREIGLTLTAMPTVRGAMAPPGLSPQIVTILGQAFAKAIKEPEFLAWAQKIRIQILPINHEQYLAYTLSVEKEIVKHLDKIKITK